MLKFSHRLSPLSTWIVFFTTIALGLNFLIPWLHSPFVVFFSSIYIGLKFSHQLNSLPVFFVFFAIIELDLNVLVVSLHSLLWWVFLPLIELVLNFLISWLLYLVVFFASNCVGLKFSHLLTSFTSLLFALPLIMLGLKFVIAWLHFLLCCFLYLWLRWAYILSSLDFFFFFLVFFASNCDGVKFSHRFTSFSSFLFSLRLIAVGLNFLIAWLDSLLCCFLCLELRWA